MHKQQVGMMAHIQQLQEQHHDYAGRSEHMIANLIERVQGLQMGLEDRDSIDFQHQIHCDNLMEDMLHYMHGMGMPPSPPHNGPPRGRGRYLLIQVLFPFPTFIKILRTMFGSSVGEELYCFPFIAF